MEKSAAQLTAKDEAFRSFALQDNMWHVIFQVCAPLALYQSLNQIFKMLDTMMAAHISAESISTVAYLSQINMTLAAIGGGLAVGASLKISEAYGAGDYELVKSRVSSLFGLCALLSIAILLFILPFTTQFLRLANTPEEMIALGSQYFIVELLGMIISFFNNVYIAIERARGNSKRILYLNLLTIAIKLILTASFVYILRSGITMIAVATILSQLVILAAAFINMRDQNNAFGFSLKSIRFKGRVTTPMIVLSIPVIAEKIAFSLGKVVVNSMSTVYGALTVGALGISNTIGGMTTVPQNGFQDGGAAIISQNLGANNPQRALDAFKKILIINVIIGAIGYIVTIGFLDAISTFFAGDDTVFATHIARIYYFEAMACIPLGINAAVMALLYGFGYTKLTLLINFSRVFVFRMPVLWALQTFTNLGTESVGIVMMVSNILTGVLAAAVAAVMLKKIYRQTNTPPVII
ncbi:MATE family efflux transporter [Cellulosilyticum sp. I15G10I2]|uniref:MATE family efflux transporter n=1 Tax=Cellulosilyticum sp. I15G10I2 TaxID=1892843 RepID=UPI00085C8EA7|nr:MATE family efflux transporter [Cellulosilyticum sp. I15G10I2]